MALGKHVMLLLCHLLLLLLLKADSKCPKSYRCGNFTLEFPFTVSSDPDCGMLTVDGCDSAEEHPSLNTSRSSYQILEKKSTNAFLVRDRALHESLPLPQPQCHTVFNLSLPESPFVSFTFSPNLTFYACYNFTFIPQIHDYFQSYRSLSCEYSTVYYETRSTHQDHALPIPSYCTLIRQPIKSGNTSGDLRHLLTADFTLEWNVSQDCNECYHEGGQCLSDNKQNFYCSEQGISFFFSSSNCSRLQLR